MIGLAVCVCTGIDDTGLDFTALSSTDLSSKGIVIDDDTGFDFTALRSTDLSKGIVIHRGVTTGGVWGGVTPPQCLQMLLLSGNLSKVHV